MNELIQAAAAQALTEEDKAWIGGVWTKVAERRAEEFIEILNILKEQGYELLKLEGDQSQLVHEHFKGKFMSAEFFKQAEEMFIKAIAIGRAQGSKTEWKPIDYIDVLKTMSNRYIVLNGQCVIPKSVLDLVIEDFESKMTSPQPDSQK
jgi:hypothetical protein